MTSNKIVIRILLLVAKMISSPDWQKEIQDLANHISTFARESA